MTAEQAIDWILHLATPPRPSPSAWTDIEWCNHWREQRHDVLMLLKKLRDARSASTTGDPL